MNGHVKLEPLQQLGEVLNINIRSNPLFLYIIVVTLYVNEKGQTWKILLVSERVTLCTSGSAVHIICWHSARGLSVIHGWHNLHKFIYRMCEIRTLQDITSFSFIISFTIITFFLWLDNFL